MSATRMPKFNHRRNVVNLARSVNVFLWGHPGVGKTSKIIADAEALNAYVITLIVSQREPVQFSGYRSVNESTQYDAKGKKYFATRIHPDVWFVEAHEKAKDHPYVVVFFDELNSADNRNIRAVQNILTSKAVENLPLPDNCILIAAGNPADSGTGVAILSKAMTSRLAHYWFEVDVDDFVENFPSYWNRDTGYYKDNDKDRGIYAYWRATVAAFIRQRRDLLFVLPESNEQNGWPCPRSWDQACRLATNYGGNDIGVAAEAFGACVGLDATSAFVQFLNGWTIVPPEDLLQGKVKITDLNKVQVFAAVMGLRAYVLDHARAIKDFNKCKKEIKQYFTILNDVVHSGGKKGGSAGFDDFVGSEIQKVTNGLVSSLPSFDLSDVIPPELHKKFAHLIQAG
jgi:hypothetical protein